MPLCQEFWIQSVVKVLVYERGLKRLNGSPR